MMTLKEILNKSQLVDIMANTKLVQTIKFEQVSSKRKLKKLLKEDRGLILNISDNDEMTLIYANKFEDYWWHYRPRYSVLMWPIVDEKVSDDKMHRYIKTGKYYFAMKNQKFFRANKKKKNNDEQLLFNDILKVKKLFAKCWQIRRDEISDKIIELLKTKSYDTTSDGRSYDMYSVSLHDLTQNIISMDKIIIDDFFLKKFFVNLDDKEFQSCSFNNYNNYDTFNTVLSCYIKHNKNMDYITLKRTTILRIKYFCLNYLGENKRTPIISREDYLYESLKNVDNNVDSPF